MGQTFFCLGRPVVMGEGITFLN